MSYAPVAMPLPFRVRRLASGSVLGISRTGDHALLTDSDLSALERDASELSIERRAYLQSRFFLATTGPSAGTQRLALSRRAAKRETVFAGPALHIIVPTLQCAHSCKYCQVSRSLEDSRHAMSVDMLEAACDTIFESQAPALTVEFQGGDPLLRFDLVRHAILRISARNFTEGRAIRFVVASTLHQLDEQICAFFREHAVYLSTSIDGPYALHNKNRPTPTRDSHARTVRGIRLARDLIGEESVSALMTTTRESLAFPEAIVDEYVRLGFRDIFLRPLSSYGFAKRNQALLGYSISRFQDFYLRALDRVIYWNQKGVELREVYASIVLNKMLSTFDSGYVDLQSPTGSGSSVLVYNYDGLVYPSDEARMLAETGDRTLAMGRIGAPMRELMASHVRRQLVEASTVDAIEGCRSCAYNLFCAPNPVDAQAQHGSMFAPVATTEHCQRHMWLFDTFYSQLETADEWKTGLFHAWAMPRRGA
jgi:His-Xaa-Ser system radical SAM maturase HxsB